MTKVVRWVTDKERQKMIDLALAGASQHEIAAIVGRAPGHVAQYTKGINAGRKLSPDLRRAKQIVRVYDAWKAGGSFTLEDAAKGAGYSSADSFRVCVRKARRNLAKAGEASV